MPGLKQKETQAYEEIRISACFPTNTACELWLFLVTLPFILFVYSFPPTKHPEEMFLNKHQSAILSIFRSNLEN
ncbi:hypothetical protein RLOC_00009941 [Lonchura striata]|uniref:Uncharacterized protein n=1 Tax=Lonchura striata TaxID=40157 RepID=A0A218V987_9PASE|nr:hypothetical protein RLOC_00009941 [Lonchura striata domestica]